ncbi:MAG: hypothetical protein WKF31_09200 [Thermoleophilaceae bacterium]
MTPVASDDAVADARGEVGMGVEARAGGRAPERNLGEPRQRGVHPVAAEPDLAGVARELLSERDGHGVHEVGAARFDHVGQLLGLGRETPRELLERGLEPVARVGERRQVHGRGEDVVGGLPHVDVVVGVHVLAGEAGDDLVGVHVRRGARAGLEDVDRELVVVAAVRHLVGGGGDALGLVGVELSELGVGARAPRP